MTLDSLCRVAAAAGLATATATAGAQTIAPEVTVPLGDTTATAYGTPYGTTYGTTYGTPYQSPINVEGGVVYDRHGGAHPAYTGNAYGFAPPSRNPIESIPVQYLRYYPAVWYGLPGSTLPVTAPQVHMPTDTTQLGFYYQRVPTWAPVPGMIPPPPNPADYHHYASGWGGGMMTATTTVDGATVSTDGTITSNDPNVRIISSRRIDGSESTSASSGTTTPVPPAPGGSGSALPLQPPPAPPAAR